MTRVISEAHAQKLLALGWKKADLHVHSTASHDVLPSPHLSPVALYEKAKAQGMHYITFTEHDTMQGFAQLGEREGLVRGVEVSLFDKTNVGHMMHINVYTLSDEQYAVIEKICAEEQNIYSLVKYLQAQNLPYLFNHPYWCKQGHRFNQHVVEKLAPLFPVIELNMGIVKAKNDLAWELAARHDKGVVANTDTHIGEVGRAYTLAQGDTFAEFWENVCLGNSYIVRKDLDASCLINEVNKRLDSLFSPATNEQELVAFTQRASLHVPNTMVKLLLTARKYRASRFLVKQSLAGVSMSRVPSTIYFTSQWRACKSIRKAAKQQATV